MIRIEKNEPNFFKVVKKKIKNINTISAWKEDEFIKIKSRLREHIIKEQKKLCAYCQRKIEDKHGLGIDHFKKKDLFPKLILDYNNLFVSCKSKYHCEKSKDNIVKLEDYKNIIHPTYDIPEEYFKYNLTGEIVPRDNLENRKKEKALFTIKIFNLNYKSLVEDRKKLSNAIIEFILNSKYDLQSMSNDEIEKWFISLGFDIYIGLVKELINNQKTLSL